MSELLRPKFCVFCGVEPVQKTKEHIIPKWLIKLTGNEHRKARFGFDLLATPPQLRVYSWNAFAFPACNSCNETWSVLEARAQAVVLTMFENGNLSAEDLLSLLDWLDKVRVGIWLGMNYLNKNIAGIVPHFHIANRIRQKDRMLIIFRSKDYQEGIFLSGATAPVFQLMPSVFHITINNLHFVSASSDFLLAKNFGWAYANAPTFIPGTGGAFSLDLVQGSNEISEKILDFLPPLTGRCLFQPIANQDVVNEYPELTENFYHKDFIRKNSIFPANAIGRIFVHNQRPDVYPDEQCDLWQCGLLHPYLKLIHQLSLFVAQFQLITFGNYPDFSEYSDEVRDDKIKLYEMYKEAQNEYIKCIQSSAPVLM